MHYISLCAFKRILCGRVKEYKYTILVIRIRSMVRCEKCIKPVQGGGNLAEINVLCTYVGYKPTHDEAPCRHTL